MEDLHGWALPAGQSRSHGLIDHPGAQRPAEHTDHRHPIVQLEPLQGGGTQTGSVEAPVAIRGAAMLPLR